MGTKAKAGACLKTLVKMALPLLKQAEAQCPRGPGAPPTVPDWLLAALIMIVILKKKKSKAAQLRYLRAHRSEIAEWLESQQFPSRSMYYRRYRRAHRMYEVAVRLQGQQAIGEGVANPQHLAADKSLIEGQGPLWHAPDRKRNHVPHGVDTDTTWGQSKHDGWMQGYSYEVVVTATPDSIVFPLLASADTASTSESKTFDRKIDRLPEGIETVSADSAYDTNHLGERIEYEADGRRTGRHFLCRENPRHNSRQKTKPCGADASRACSRERRKKRRAFYETKRGRKIYARRKKTVEPFNQWFKSLFELDYKVWHRGLDNNRTQLLAAIFAYQLLVRYNHKKNQFNGQIRHLLDAL